MLLCVSVGARVSDAHVCPLHGGGTIATGFATGIVGGMPASRISDIFVCGPIPNPLVTGSTTVLIGKFPASRITEAAAHAAARSHGWPVAPGKRVAVGST